MTDQPPNIIDLPNIERDQMKGSFEEMARTLHMLMEHAPSIANAKRAFFEAYLAQGFSEAQAVELCKNIVSI